MCNMARTDFMTHMCHYSSTPTSSPSASYEGGTVVFCSSSFLCTHSNLGLPLFISKICFRISTLSRKA